MSFAIIFDAKVLTVQLNSPLAESRPTNFDGVVDCEIRLCTSVRDHQHHPRLNRFFNHAALR